jgi:hypothetical protein
LDFGLLAVGGITLDLDWVDFALEKLTRA